MSTEQNTGAPASTTGEQQTCPRRMGEFGPWEHKDNLDSWETNRWTDDPAEAEAKIAEFMAKYPTGSCASNQWPGPGPKPRTCSFCGGVHPDDAITLLEYGWEVEPTDKSYKRYMNAPGYREHFAAVMNSIGGEFPKDGYRNATPPVKLYVMHFDADQIERFNKALAIGRVR